MKNVRDPVDRSVSRLERELDADVVVVVPRCMEGHAEVHATSSAGGHGVRRVGFGDGGGAKGYFAAGELGGGILLVVCLVRNARRGGRSRGPGRAQPTATTKTSS